MSARLVQAAFWVYFAIVFFALVALSPGQNPKEPRMWYTQSSPGAPLVNFKGYLEQTKLTVHVKAPAGFNGIFQVHYVSQAGVSEGVASPSWIYVTNGVPSPSSFDVIYNPNFVGGTRQVTDTPQTARFRGFRINAPNPADNKGGEHIASWGPYQRRKVGEKDVPVPAQETTTLTDSVDVYLTGVAPDPCPPRENLTFTLNMNMPSSGDYEVNLVVDGASVYGSRYSSGVVGKSSTTFTVPNITTAHGNFAYAWLVNGVIKATGNYDCGSEIPNNHITNTVDSGPAIPINSDNSTPGNPVPDYPNQPDPIGTVPPKGGSTTPPTKPTPNGPKPLPIGGNFTGSGDQEDIYQAVRKALTDSGNEVSKPGVNQDDIEDGSAHLDSRGKLDETQDKLNQGIHDAAQAKTIFSSKFVDFAKVDLPTGIGKVDAINFGTLHYASKNVVLKMDFTEWKTEIAMWRNAMLWVFGVTWVFSMVWMVRSYI